MFIDVLIFLLVLSALVFFHELGHFLAAKACGIYVDRFSIGMPPRLFGFRLGETDYCVGALPIGGFVKMAGQEDSPLSEEERQSTYGHVPPERWFNKKPVWQRYTVILAGPLMNLVLGVVLYLGVAILGDHVPEWEVVARVGDVEEGSAAASAPLYDERPGAAIADYAGEPAAVGWRTGDFIVSIDGTPAENNTDLAMTAVLGGADQAHLVILERIGDDGTRRRYASPITPTVREGEERPSFGVWPFDVAMVGEALPDMPADRAGLQPDDIIERINGTPVCVKTMISYIESVPMGNAVVLDVLRDDERVELTMTPETIGRIRGLSLGAADAEAEDPDQSRPAVLSVSDELKEATGLHRKDVITEINGQAATVALLQELEKASPDGTLQLSIERPAVLFGLVQKPDSLEIEVPVDAVRWIGVTFAPKTVFVKAAPSEVVPEALRQSYKAVTMVVGTVYALITGSVSPKEIGGPVLIYQLTTAAADEGVRWLLKIAGFISVNLFIVNLLPIPVLDGGLLVVLGIEAVRRKPLSEKFQERFQSVGLMMIVGLMIFVTWNDVARLITSIKP